MTVPSSTRGSRSGAIRSSSASRPLTVSLDQRCPLHAEADFIFHDEESVTPELESQLRVLPPQAPIAFARSRQGSDGPEFAVGTRIGSARANRCG